MTLAKTFLTSLASIKKNDVHDYFEAVRAQLIVTRETLAAEHPCKLASAERESERHKLDVQARLTFTERLTCSRLLEAEHALRNWLASSALPQWM